MMHGKCLAQSLSPQKIVVNIISIAYKLGYQIYRFRCWVVTHLGNYRGKVPLESLLLSVTSKMNAIQVEF